MIAGLVLTLAAQAAPLQTPMEPVLGRMLSLYDEICLRAFPDDAALDALMATKGAKPLTLAEVAVTLRDDPGRGWLIQDGDRSIQITLELPPFHACSVRRMTDAGFADLAPYRALVDRYKAVRPGFVGGPPMDRTLGDLQIHAEVEQRPLPGGRTETLMVFDQRMADESKRKAGESAINVRFVHQIVDRGAK